MRAHVNTTHPNIRRLLPISTSIGRVRTVESRVWTAPQPSYARRRWKKIDTTGRGYIELHQLLDGSIVQGGTCPLQALEYDYEMFATEAGRGVFAAADLDGDGRIDMAGFSKIVHVRPHPYSTRSKAQHDTRLRMACTMHCLPRATHALACRPRSPHPGLNTSKTLPCALV